LSETSATSAITPSELAALPIRPRRHPLRILGAAIVIAMLVFLIYSFANGKLDWSQFSKYLTAETILRGVVNTILISFLSMVLGLVLGTVFAIMRLSKNVVLSTVAWFYVWLFRGTPLLLQLLLWYNLALIFPTIGPFETVTIMTPLVAALLGLGIKEGAYLAEIIRGGIVSVDSGQEEAGRALSFSGRQRMRYIVLPQALPAIVPAIGNETVGMMKTSSLAAVISFNELLTGAQMIYFRNGAIIELLFVAAFWYLVVVSVTSAVQFLVERSLAKRRGSSTRETAIVGYFRKARAALSS